MNLPQSNISILHDSQEWSTDLEGDITEIKVDGKRLNNIHDLTIKIDKMTTIIKALTFTTTILVVVTVCCVLAMSSWLAVHYGKISDKLSTKVTDKEAEMLQGSQRIMNVKLKSLGWQWKDGGWRQIADTDRNPTK